MPKKSCPTERVLIKKHQLLASKCISQFDKPSDDDNKQK